MKALSLLGFLAMVAGIVGLIASRRLLSPSPVVVAFQLAAVALMVWARITFGRRSFHAAADPTGGGLVTSGPYRFVRHPIYTAVVLFCLAGAALHASPLALGLAALVVAGAVARMLAEERLLLERHPEYADYAARTARMLPGVF